MMIPRYRTYWRASGLWAVPRIPYPWRMAAGAAVMLFGLPLAHAWVVEPWNWVAHFGLVIAGLGLLCWTR